MSAVSTVSTCFLLMGGAVMRKNLEYIGPNKNNLYDCVLFSIDPIADYTRDC